MLNSPTWLSKARIMGLGDSEGIGDPDKSSSLGLQRRESDYGEFGVYGS